MYFEEVQFCFPQLIIEKAVGDAGSFILLQIVKTLYTIARAPVLSRAMGSLDENLCIQHLILSYSKRGAGLYGLAEVPVSLAIGNVKAG
jgi:hypothetical protein